MDRPQEEGIVDPVIHRRLSRSTCALYDDGRRYSPRPSVDRNFCDYDVNNGTPRPRRYILRSTYYPTLLFLYTCHPTINVECLLRKKKTKERQVKDSLSPEQKRSKQYRMYDGSKTDVTRMKTTTTNIHPSIPSNKKRPLTPVVPKDVISQLTAGWDL